MADRNMNVIYGLVTVPTKRSVAIDKPQSMSNLCVGQPGTEIHEPSPVTMPKTCKVCGPITDTEVLQKGIKQGSAYVLVDKEAVADAKAEYGKQYQGSINVVPHPAEEFLAHTSEGDSLHYLTPADAGNEGHYQLLVRLVSENPQYAFAGLFTTEGARGTTSLYMLTVREGVLCLAKRTRGQALRPLPSVGGECNDQFYGVLTSTLEQFVVPYDPDAYEDTYRAKIDGMVAEGETIVMAGDTKPEALATLAQSDDDIMAKVLELAAKRKVA